MSPVASSTYTASPVAQHNQGRVPGLSRGPGSTSKLQSLPYKRNSLRILQCNINGLTSAATKVKLDQIQDMAEFYAVQIIALQETKLRETSQLNVKGYHIFRSDRPNRGGGGLALLIRDVAYQHIDIPLVNTELEMQGILVNWNKGRLKIFNMYHPPNQSRLTDSLFVHGPLDSPSIYLGDINAKHHIWGCSVDNPRGVDLLKAVDDEALMFLNDGSPTHFSFGYDTAEALDVSFVSADIFPKCQWTVLKNVGSDHLPILIEIRGKHLTPTVKENFWNFRKADWLSYTEMTEQKFRDVSFSDDLEANWKLFKDTIIFSARQSIPRGNIRKPKQLYSCNTPEILDLVRKRDLLFQNLKDSYSIDQRVELNKTNAVLKRAYAICKRKSWGEMCSNIDARTSNTKLWKLAKALDRHNPQVEKCNTILDPIGRIPDNDKAAADLLGSHYRQVSRLIFERGDKPIETRARKCVHKCRSSALGDPIFITNFSMHELNTVLKEVNPRKSPGPDNIHGQLLLHLGPSGKLRLLDIFNLSWMRGRIPLDWKKAIVIPIRKTDKAASSPESYRPISLTCISCKLLEKMLLNRLNYYLEANDLLPKEQYGFRKGHNTIDQILYFCQSVKDAQNLRPTNHTVAAFLDLTKAFDKVWHNKLIVKLFDIFGVRGRALPWIADFLKARDIRVKFNKTLSRDFRLSQGVPQGSVLGPILFSLFFVGIEQVISKRCRVGVFADDVVLWQSGTDTGAVEDSINLTLKEVTVFANEHKLTFNPMKSVTSFYTTNRHKYNYKPTLILNGMKLHYEKNAKYLGFTTDQEILSNRHIQALEVKCRKRLNILKYISGRDWGADASTLKMTYISLIRPILEYGFPIYNCASESNLIRLEKVQTSAAKIIAGLRRSCPDNIALYECDLQPLRLRRDASIVKYFHKLISYGDQNRTASYLRNWKPNQRLKRNSPFSQVASHNTTGLLPPGQIEFHSLRSCFSPVHDFNGVHFHPELSYPTQKNSDNPEFLKQMAYETISHIPPDSLQMYTDGSRSDRGHSGSGVFIRTPATTFGLKYRNPDSCSVFRSELIAIEKGLSFVEGIAVPDFTGIWILTDSRSSIQYLSNWMEVGDRAGISILSSINRLLQQFEVHIQWIPSHVGVSGNEKADTLAKAATLDIPQPYLSSTFSEIFSERKKAINQLWRLPLGHDWYPRKSPGGAISFEGNRYQQSCISRFASGHLKSMTFEQGLKIFKTCTKCETAQASPEHILICMDFKLDEVFSKPLQFLDFLGVFGLVELV